MLCAGELSQESAASEAAGSQLAGVMWWWLLLVSYGVTALPVDFSAFVASSYCTL